MKFYDALQLGPEELKAQIARSEPPQKRWWRTALIVRGILIVLFAILFISSLTAIFGSENSSMAVVIFCILLSIRFVDFGYQIGHSLISLAVIFALLLFSPWLMQQVSPFIGFVINFLSLMVIVVLSCEDPRMGNGGLYLFGYVFLTGSLVSQDVLLQRALLTLIGYLICAGILYQKHRSKHSDVPVSAVLEKFDLRTPKSQWQLQLALGVSILFLLNALLHLDRFMWAGFACSSLLSTYPVKIRERFPARIGGVVLGSLAFGALYALLPADLLFLLGPVSGLCLGLCATYRYKALFNCFGALSLAVTVYGLHGSILLRVCNNILGMVFGSVFFWFFQKLFPAAEPSS